MAQVQDLGCLIRNPENRRQPQRKYNVTLVLETGTEIPLMGADKNMGRLPWFLPSPDGASPFSRMDCK